MSEEQLIQTPGVFGETGNFLLERELGRGGMGGVYMGRDKMLDRPVAVKVMLKEYGDDPEFVEKFKREAQAAAKLIHPNIAQIYSYGIANGMPYIAMELVAGGSLDKLMENSGATIDIPRVMKICEQVAQALRCAADQGLVHGDIKPENVLLDSNGNAKIVDFGLAAMQKDTDEIWGTPYYIAPEKVKKEPVDFRADMYSLGGTIYHALTGVAPFEGDDAAAVVRKRFEGPAAPPSSIRADISPQIDALVMKMLALNPADRFPSFEALLEEFRRVMASGLTANGGSGGGGRKIAIKGRKRFKMKTSTSLGAVGKEGEEDGDGGESNRSMPSSSGEQEEEGGSVIGKVLGVVGITIAAIGLVAGGLVWYVVADRKAREAELRAEISRKMDEAKASIADTRKNAVKFAEEICQMADKSVSDCDKTTERLRKELSGRVDAARLDAIKPSPTGELVAAISLTNAVLQAGAPNADTNVVATAGAPNADTNAVAVASAAEASSAASEQTAPSAFEAAISETLSGVIRDMNGLWERAYGCKAAALRIRKSLDDLVAKIDAFKVAGDDVESVEKAAAFSREVKDAYDMVKASEDVSKVQKAGNFIRSRGANTVDQASKRLLVAVKEEERRKAAAEKAEKAAAAAAAAEESKRNTIEADNARVKEKFDALVSTGAFRQLDWKGAIRQLKATSDEFKYSESQLFAMLFVKKVNMMAAVQEVFIANCKGYKFARSKLANCTITEISEKDGLKLTKPDGKTHMKITWVKFYQQYHGNLNELIVKFIEKGKDSSKLKDGKRLSLQPWADAMMGAALTMQIICGDDPTAPARAEQIARNAVKALPDYLKSAQEIFPDITFDAASEE